MGQINVGLKGDSKNMYFIEIAMVYTPCAWRIHIKLVNFVCTSV